MAEFVHSNNMASNAAGTAYVDTSTQEGWYVTNILSPCKFFMKDAPGIDLNFRYENYNNNINAGPLHKPWQFNAEQAITYGLKWSYIGKNYTSLNYTMYALNGDFKVIGPTDLIVLQQQFNF
jgi:hypothetical protein